MSRLVLVVSRAAVMAVDRHWRAVRWSGAEAYDGPGDLPRAIAQVLQGRLRGDRSCRVGLETDVCPVKLLRGLPPVSGARLRGLMRLQASRWFLLTKPIIADAVWYEKRQVALAAAAEEPLVTIVVSAIEEAGLTVESVAPVIPSLAANAGDGTHRRRAGTILETLEIRKGRIASIRRSLLPAGENDEAESPAWTGAAAVAHRTAPLRLVPRTMEKRVGMMRLRRLVGAGVAAAVSVLLAGAGYLWRLDRDARAASARLAELQPVVDQALVVERDTRLADAAMAVIWDAEHNRSRDLLLIETLTRVLPDSAYLSSLTRERSQVVRLTGATSPTARFAGLLNGIPGIAGAAMQAPAPWAPGAGGTARFSATFTWRAGDAAGE